MSGLLQHLQTTTKSCVENIGKLMYDMFIPSHINDNYIQIPDAPTDLSTVNIFTDSSTVNTPIDDSLSSNNNISYQTALENILDISNYDESHEMTDYNDLLLYECNVPDLDILKKVIEPTQIESKTHLPVPRFSVVFSNIIYEYCNIHNVSILDFIKIYNDPLLRKLLKCNNNSIIPKIEIYCINNGISTDWFLKLHKDQCFCIDDGFVEELKTYLEYKKISGVEFIKICNIPLLKKLLQTEPIHVL